MSLHTIEDKPWTDQQSTNPLILMVKRQQPFSQRPILCHIDVGFSTEVTYVANQSLSMTSI